MLRAFRRSPPSSAVAVASFVPEVGRSEGLLHLGKVTDAGVFLLFFLHGMGLSTDSLKTGAAKWKLHALVQACTAVNALQVPFGLALAIPCALVTQRPAVAAALAAGPDAPRD